MIKRNERVTATDHNTGYKYTLYFSFQNEWDWGKCLPSRKIKTEGN
jgi:hypothetical protein